MDPTAVPLNKDLHQPEQLQEQHQQHQQENKAFPSLTDTALRQLGLYLQSTANHQQQVSENSMKEEDIECKFTTLMLAFKTDKLTLTRRLELQNRLRDQTELNMTNEVEALKSVVQLLEPICADSEKQEIYDRICNQVEGLHKSVLRVSSVAEVFGAVQQENRLSKAVDVIMVHVEKLKEVYIKEKSEHEETKKLLNENKPPAGGVAALLKDKRRASIATLHRHQSQGEYISTSHTDLKSIGMRRGPHGRRLMHTKSDYISDQHLGTRTLSVGDATDMIILEQDINPINGSDSYTHTDGFDNRRLSHQHSSELDSESEEECLNPNCINPEDCCTGRLPVRYKFRKRSSLVASTWLLSIGDRLDWLRHFEDLALQARYFLAGLCLIAALGVLSSGFIQNHNSS